MVIHRLWDLEKAGSSDGENKEGKELKATINAGPTEAWYANIHHVYSSLFVYCLTIEWIGLIVSLSLVDGD